MLNRFLLFAAIIVTTNTDCQNATSEKKQTSPDTLILDISVKDTIQPTLAPYSELTYLKEETLTAAPGTKSVIFNTNGSKLYAMNLEGMSVYEFDQASRKLTRKLRFKPTIGIGWDYTSDKPIRSFEEKPVEACFTDNDSTLWVSLHNAEGIVPIPVLANSGKLTEPNNNPVKKIIITYPRTSTIDSFNVPLIKTGKTPKVISRTSDSKYLLVSNWHSYNVSVLQLDKKVYPYGKLISTIPVSAIPRGIVIDDNKGKSYVAIMGGSSIAVINNANWKMEKTIEVASNPRHVVMDTAGRLFVSYNKLAKVACIDPETGKTLFTAPTHTQPRTIMLSKNHKFLFVTCYSGNTVEVFKINNSSFTKVASLPSKGKPVGVDIFENDEKLEAWVCSYTDGAIRIYSFKKG